MKKWSCTKNILEQKHTFKKQTDSSWSVQPIWKTCASHIGSFWHGSGWKFKKCLKLPPRFSCKTPRPSKVWRNRSHKVTKTRQPRHMARAASLFVRGERKWPVLNVFWSCCCCCCCGGENFSVKLLKLKFLFGAFCSKGMRLPCPMRWDLQNSINWNSQLLTNHLLPTCLWWKAPGQFPSCRFRFFFKLLKKLSEQKLGEEIKAEMFGPSSKRKVWMLDCQKTRVSTAFVDSLRIQRLRRVEISLPKCGPSRREH